MKITNEQISKIIEDCKLSGYTIKVRDISFVILSENYEDISLAYKVVFGSDFEDNEVMEYNTCKAISFLRRYIQSNYKENVSKGLKKGSTKDISFEENKEYMLEIKRQTEEAMANDEISKKDGLKILADISVKLNDKFNVQEEVKEQMVVLNCKYNDVCTCGREIYVPTKEDLMKKYNLIEKK